MRSADTVILEQCCWYTADALRLCTGYPTTMVLQWSCRSLRVSNNGVGAESALLMAHFLLNST